jgi:hypothetical protein
MVPLARPFSLLRERARAAVDPLRGFELRAMTSKQGHFVVDRRRWTMPSGNVGISDGRRFRFRFRFRFRERICA